VSNSGVFRTFRDPIHQFVDVNRLEAELVDTRPFQRLRHIRQLALTCYVYPDAEHRRFSHSLGVMQFGTRIFDTLVAKGLAQRLAWSTDATARNRQLVRLACLLHDLGHPPFSHAGEEGSLFRPDVTHEHYSHKLILQGDLAQVLADPTLNPFAITPQEVVEVLQGTAGGILHEIVDGDFDADKMDYLRRDSWHAGVDYGRFDHVRLVESLIFRLSDEGPPVLAVEEGGMHAAEAMVTARYWMFTQVYFHDVRRAYDWHLADSIRDILAAATGEPFYPDEVESYLGWDDNTVFTALRQSKDQMKADRLLRRKHWKVCAQTTAQPDRDALVRFMQRASTATDATGSAYADYALQHRLKVTYSRDFQVRLEAGGGFQPLCVVSPLVRSLEPIAQARLYAAPEVSHDAAKLMGPEFAVAKEEAA